MSTVVLVSESPRATDTDAEYESKVRSVAVHGFRI